MQFAEVSFIHLKPGFTRHLEYVQFLFAPVDSCLDSLTHSLEDLICLGVGSKEDLIHGHLHTSTIRVSTKEGYDRH